MGESASPASVRIDREQIEAVDKLAESLYEKPVTRSYMIRVLIKFALENYGKEPQGRSGTTIKNIVDQRLAELGLIPHATKKVEGA